MGEAKVEEGVKFEDRDLEDRDKEKQKMQRWERIRRRRFSK